jgi:hypothetical protein
MYFEDDKLNAACAVTIIQGKEKILERKKRRFWVRLSFRNRKLYGTRILYWMI